MGTPAVGDADPTNERSKLLLWPAKPHHGQGRRHGTSTSAPFDRWFRYPAGFATDYADLLVSHLKLTPGDLLVDCFAGSGVIGTAARTAHLRFAGIEAHPMIAELARLKLQLPDDAGDVRRTASKLAGRTHAAGPHPLLDDVPALLTRSFDVAVLDTLLRLRDQIQVMDDTTTAPYLKWALLGTLRDVANVKVGWPYQRPGIARQPRHTDVEGRFLQRVAWMVKDLSTVRRDRLRRTVVLGDARDPASWMTALGARKADGSVSSPPYLNNFDYADATRLEAYFWGEASSWSDLVRRIRGDMLTATTQQASLGRSIAALAALAPSAIGSDVDNLATRLAQERTSRARGKEYDRSVPEYFRAMQQVFQQLSRHMRRGAPVAWLVGDSAPYGVYVDTPSLLGRLAADHGFVQEADVTLRYRGRRWTGAGNRHDLQLTERLLVLRRE